MNTNLGSVFSITHKHLVLVKNYTNTNTIKATFTWLRCSMSFFFVRRVPLFGNASGAADVDRCLSRWCTLTDTGHDNQLWHTDATRLVAFWPRNEPAAVAKWTELINDAWSLHDVFENKSCAGKRTDNTRDNETGKANRAEILIIDRNRCVKLVQTVAIIIADCYITNKYFMFKSLLCYVCLQT